MHNYAFAQRSCGAQQVRASIIAKHPEAAQKFEEQRASLQGIADNYKLHIKTGVAEKTTATSPIPVIFHIVVNSAQFTQLGGTAGISRRCDSQIAVLNRDYNRQNSDSVLIPSLWKPLYASAGIHFGLAHTDPTGHATPGYEVKITSTSFVEGPNSYSDAKHAGTSGLDSWDETKYLNVWCINFSDNTGLLGVTVPKSYGTSLSEVGICINYGVLGKRSSPSDYYIQSGTSLNYYDLGRTLTHEIGHFFEIWHTWGDDNGLCPFYVKASCPYHGTPTAGSGSDDGLNDTPPEGDSKYDVPVYTGILGGTFHDCCATDTFGTSYQPIGVASLDFMNYTDDKAMQLFTPDQAAVMATQVSIVGVVTGENYSLTQNPGLLNWPANTGIEQTTIKNGLNIFPNPSTGTLYITFNQATDELKQISIFNIIGQEVQNINIAEQQKEYYSIDLSGMSKGIYFVRCNFASGSITRKILLQ